VTTAKPSRLPDPASAKYLWWSQGAADEAKARDEGMSPAARELRDVLEAFARLRPTDNAGELAETLAKIYCPDRLRRRRSTWPRKART
jgi:hypothetical protein